MRYNPQDAYQIGATSPEEIVFEVSSTKDWIVYGNADWYNINPASGTPGSIYKVTIRANDNTELDDRVDTVTIQSDYWIGKKFAINQKGTAFIAIEDKDTVFTKDAGEKRMVIKSNQNWSLKVTSGGEWLSIVGGESGSLDGSFSVKAVANKGERRFGEITMYDRNNEAYDVLRFVQEGVTLEAETYSFRVPKLAGTYRLPVESNTEWKISKPDDISWINFNQTSFNGDATVEISYMENTGSAVRRVELRLETIGGAEGVEPVTKTVVLKQAPTLNGSRHQFNQSGPNWGQWNNLKPVYEDGDLILKIPGGTEDRNRSYIANVEYGIYSIGIKSTNITPENQSEIYLGMLFSSNNYEGYTYIIASNSATNLSAPGGPALNNITVDYTKEFVMTISIEQQGENLYVEWWLDGLPFATYLDTSFKPSIPLLTILLGIENASWLPGVSILSAEKSLIADWWEYSPPVDWGD
ncbi:MAG: hypothetical protein LBQ39_08190 [Tannerellaceae bacterium]|nr:hypothetical protein [Tannerellaceae bacterium]